MLKTVNIKKLKNIGAKTVLTVMTVATLVTPLTFLTGCGAKNATDTAAETSIVASETQEAEVQTSHEFTQEAWDNFVDEKWAEIDGKVNNIDKESFRNALTIFNIDYLEANNSDILVNYYTTGYDVENRSNNAYNFLSQIREYNTKITNPDEYYSIKGLLISEKDKVILGALDAYYTEIATMDLTNEANKAHAEEIFNTILSFSKGTGKIAVAVGGEIVEVAQIELSKGGVLASENTMQDISVMLQNTISEERRAELDNSLRSKDVIAKIQETITKYGAIGEYVSEKTSEEEIDAMVSDITAHEDYIANEVSAYGVTAEESNALFTIAQIDWFMQTTDGNRVFDKIFAEGFKINETFTLAESAVEKIEEANRNLPLGERFDYGHYFLYNETDILSIRALLGDVYMLNSEDETVVAEAVNEIKGYTQYSSQATVNYQYVSKDGTIAEEVISLDKNALDKGGNQVVDWITYYDVLANENKFGTQLTTDLVSYVSERGNGLTPYEDIVLMVEDYCAESNVVVYDYEVGKEKVKKN